MESKKMADASNDQFSCGPEGTDYYHWTGMLMNLPAPYDGGIFNFSIVFPTEYPFKAPKITFTTKVYHPNISEKGEVCDAILGRCYRTSLGIQRGSSRCSPPSAE